MLLVETQPTTTTPAFNAASHFRLRIRAAGTSQQVVELRQAKTTIGSSPRCDIRIGQPGVQPLHCLILCEGGGLSVRRWAAGTRLNGQPFDEAPLAPGDRLAVGDVELELEVASEALAAAKTEGPWGECTTASAVEPPSSPPAAHAFESWGEWNSTQLTELRGEQQDHAIPQSCGDNSVLPADQAAWPEPRGARQDAPEHAKGRLTVFHDQLSQLEERLASWKDAREDWQQERTEWRAERDQVRRQTGELERQIADLQSRASEIVGRIERLEHSIAAQALVPKFEAPRLECWPSEPQTESSAESAATFEPASNSFRSFDELATPADNTAAEPTPEVEDELAPFAEFSIWRQGSACDAPSAVESASGDYPTEPLPSYSSGPAATPVDNNWQIAPAKSFIEQYGHMFAEDGAENERPSAVTPASAHSVGIADSESIIRKPQHLGRPQPDDGVPTESTSDEESIEQYMSKLLQRVRGDRPGSSASQSAAVVSHSSTSAFSPGLQPSAAYSAGPAGAPAQPAVAAHELPRSGPDGEWLTTSLGTVRRKAPMVEQPADLATLRALANESARRAIGTHGLRVHRRSAITKVIVSTLAGMTSLLMMLSAPHWKDLQFITACVSLIVAAYWAGQTYAELIDAFRAAAYDGPEDKLQGFANLLPAVLPIEVENSAKS